MSSEALQSRFREEQADTVAFACGLGTEDAAARTDLGVAAQSRSPVAYLQSQPIIAPAAIELHALRRDVCSIVEKIDDRLP
jgi:hypothetical protein